MNETAFTPGPWVPVADLDAVWSVLRDTPAVGRSPVAQTIHAPCTHLAKEARDNAALIAAAPDLYEAVSRWLTWCDDWHVGKPHPVDDLEFARAALAKARGEISQ